MPANAKPDPLAEIYARVPAIACKGLCHVSCGPVPATRLEIEAIEKTTFVPWGVDANGTCSMLFAGRCTAYEKRPLLCRLWGVVESMPCVFGCTPDRMLSDAESRGLLDAAGKIGDGYDLERVASMLETLR